MRKRILKDVCQLVTELQETIAAEAPCVITIDGIDGAGKTCLAGELARRLPAKCIGLDDFVVENQGGYVNHIQYDKLEAAISQMSESSPIIIEGVCILAVLRHVSCLRSAPSTKIYVRLTDRLGFSGREFLYSKGDSAEEVLSSNPHYRGAVEEEIVRYHFEYKPRENADFIFEIVK